MSEYEKHEQGSEIFCPANAVLNLLSGRWTLHIVRSLLEGKTRFNEIGRANGLNPATLRERLRALEEEGVVTRTVISAMPPHVEYTLTEKGLALNGIFEQIAQWGLHWMRPKCAVLMDAPVEECQSVIGEAVSAER
jgi:DNA-binding HxlR family transcriptional regulator